MSDYATPVGGAERYLHQLETVLPDHGYDVRYIGGDELDSRWAQFARSWFSVHNARKVRRAVDEFDPDVLFIGSLAHNVSPSFLLAVNEYPAVWYVPDVLQLGYRGDIDHPVRRGLVNAKKATHRTLVRHLVDAYVAPSETAASHLADDLGVEDVHVVRHPVFWEPTDSVPTRDAARRPVVGFVGRLDEEKGVPVLLDAARILASEGRAFELRIVGDGPRRDEYETRASRAGLDGTVEFRGHVPHDELKAEYRRMDVFVLPSIVKENCPLTVLESMSQGIPVVTSSHGGQAELVSAGEAGLLATPGDPQHLAAQIATLLDDDSCRRALSQNALQQARQWTPARHVAELDQVFEATVGRASGESP